MAVAVSTLSSLSVHPLRQAGTQTVWGHVTAVPPRGPAHERALEVMGIAAWSSRSLGDRGRGSPSSLANSTTAQVDNVGRKEARLALGGGDSGPPAGGVQRLPRASGAGKPACSASLPQGHQGVTGGSAR